MNPNVVEVDERASPQRQHADGPRRGGDRRLGARARRRAGRRRRRLAGADGGARGSLVGSRRRSLRRRSGAPYADDEPGSPSSGRRCSPSSSRPRSASASSAVSSTRAARTSTSRSSTPRAGASCDRRRPVAPRRAATASSTTSSASRRELARLRRRRRRRLPPDAAAFAELASDFWYHALWTARKLRRGEVFTALELPRRLHEGAARDAAEWHARALDPDARHVARGPLPRALGRSGRARRARDARTRTTTSATSPVRSGRRSTSSRGSRRRPRGGSGSPIELDHADLSRRVSEVVRDPRPRPYALAVMRVALARRTRRRPRPGRVRRRRRRRPSTTDTTTMPRRAARFASTRCATGRCGRSRASVGDDLATRSRSTSYSPARRRGASRSSSLDDGDSRGRRRRRHGRGRGRDGRARRRELLDEALAQIVYTLTQFPTVESVEIDGESYTRADFEEQTPSVLVESPLPFEEVTSPLRATGTANTFEATSTTSSPTPTATSSTRTSSPRRRAPGRAAPSTSRPATFDGRQRARRLRALRRGRLAHARGRDPAQDVAVGRAAYSHVADAPWRCSQCGTVNEPVANACRTCGRWPSLFDLESLDHRGETQEKAPRATTPADVRAGVRGAGGLRGSRARDEEAPRPSGPPRRQAAAPAPLHRLDRPDRDRHLPRDHALVTLAVRPRAR